MTVAEPIENKRKQANEKFVPTKVPNTNETSPKCGKSSNCSLHGVACNR